MFFSGGKFKKPKKIDYIIILLDVVATIIYFTSENYLLANIVVQISTVTSFWPIMRDTYKTPHNERVGYWVVWSVAYGLQMIMLVNFWEGWAEMLYPLNCFILHIIMIWLVFRKYLIQPEGNA